jgi:predicted XRE-type DNA-binding protein
MVWGRCATQREQALSPQGKLACYYFGFDVGRPVREVIFLPRFAYQKTGLSMTDLQAHFHRFPSIWDALEDTTQAAANMHLRSSLMRMLCQTIQAWKLPKKDAAERLGISQLRLKDMLDGKIDRFSLDSLVNLSMRAS